MVDKQKFLDSLNNKQKCVKIANSTDYLDCFKNTDQERENLRKKIEPWFSAILQSEHLSMLIGTGLTMATCGIANVKSSSMSTADFGSKYNDKIMKYANNEAKQMGRGKANIEDQIRTSLELLHGYEINENNTAVKELGESINEVLSNFAKSILEAEKVFNDKLEKEDKDAEWALQLLKSFIMTFSSRKATRDRLHIFTTNYDRFIEYVCDYAGIKILDRFFGKIQPYFQEAVPNLDYYYRIQDSKNEFRYVEGVIRYSKIHGSIDWKQRKNKIYRTNLKFGAEKIEDINKGTYKDQLMIYPNSMKSIETAYYPYSELFRDFSGAICRPNSSLITYGYGFGDTHINKIILEMLNIPSAHLVIISFGVDDKLLSFLNNVNLAQITLLCGDEVGDLEKLVKYYLPKSAIDNITQVASELLKNREGYDPNGKIKDQDTREGATNHE